MCVHVEVDPDENLFSSFIPDGARKLKKLMQPL